MDAGKYNRPITIQTYTEVVASGNVTGTWDAGISTRARVTMVDGKRYLRENELIDGVLYKIETWDNSYSNNIRIVYGTETLYPVRPATRNPGPSMLTEIVILATVKK